MAGWWSPLSDGIRRLVGRGTRPVQTRAARRPVSDPRLRRPSRPRAAGLAVAAAAAAGARPGVGAPAPARRLRRRSDDPPGPQLAARPVHDVQPAVGGLVDGLADLVPGCRRRTRPSSAELTVRPVRSPGTPGGAAVARTVRVVLAVRHRGLGGGVVGCARPGGRAQDERADDGRARAAVARGPRGRAVPGGRGCGDLFGAAPRRAAVDLVGCAHRAAPLDLAEADRDRGRRRASRRTRPAAGGAGLAGPGPLARPGRRGPAGGSSCGG